MLRILVIDDDEQVRGFVTELLSRKDNEVLAAANGREGVEMFKRNHIDLVITDLLMPEQEGCETIMQMIAYKPGTKIIAMSGGTRTAHHDFLPIAAKLGAKCTISKPFTSERLLRAVREVLGEGEVGKGS